MKFVNRTKIREKIKSSDLRCSESALDSLDQKLDSIVQRAIYRAEKNQRKTIFDQDF